MSPFYEQPYCVVVVVKTLWITSGRITKLPHKHCYLMGTIVIPHCYGYTAAYCIIKIFLCLREAPHIDMVVFL